MGEVEQGEEPIEGDKRRTARDLASARAEHPVQARAARYLRGALRNLTSAASHKLREGRGAKGKKVPTGLEQSRSSCNFIVRRLYLSGALLATKCVQNSGTADCF